MIQITSSEKQNGETKPKQKLGNKAGITSGIVVIIFLIFLIMFFGGGSGGDRKIKTTTTTSSIIDLSASVSFSDGQFIIVNEDNFDWTDVKLEVNSELLKSGYVLRTERMVGGEIYTVGALQFAKGDGTRFNPFVIKVLNFSIWCDTSKGQGFWYGSWE